MLCKTNGSWLAYIWRLLALGIFILYNLAAQQLNSATFLMSNMMPQVPELNRGIWGDLEVYGQELVQQGKELYIVAGARGRKGSIGKKEKIAVPAKTWKVIVVLDRQGLGMQGADANTSEAIAVMMPNDSSVKGKGWKSFLCTCEASRARDGAGFLL